LGTGPGTGTLLHITGRVKFSEDAQTRKELFSLHPWLKELGDGTENHMIAIFRIAEGEFSFWILVNYSESNPSKKIRFP